MSTFYHQINFHSKQNLDVFLSIEQDHLDSLYFQGGFKRINDTILQVTNNFIKLIENDDKTVSEHNKRIFFGKRVLVKGGGIDYIPFKPQPIIIS